MPNFRLYAITGQLRMFNSAMIAGISAIIDPRGPDSETMRKILTTFLEQNPWHEVANKDETTRKEVQIVGRSGLPRSDQIHTLSRRAAQIYDDSLGPNDHGPHEKDSASLLLALRQSGDTPYAQTPRSMGLNKGWMSLSNPLGNVLPMSSGGVHQSPASSAGQEDDHSQRLQVAPCTPILTADSTTGSTPTRPWPLARCPASRRLSTSPASATCRWLPCPGHRSTQSPSRVSFPQHPRAWA